MNKSPKFKLSNSDSVIPFGLFNTSEIKSHTAFFQLPLTSGEAMQTLCIPDYILLHTNIMIIKQFQGKVVHLASINLPYYCIHEKSYAVCSTAVMSISEYC